jgi:hypothetical protein
MSLFSILLIVGIASKSDRFLSSGETGLALSAGGVLAILAAFLWAGGCAGMIFCMKERIAVPVPTQPVSRDAGPTFSPSFATLDDPTRPVSRTAGPSYTHPNLQPTAPEDEEDEIAYSVENGFDIDLPVAESPVVDTQVERTTDSNGNETVITTTTTFLPNGSKRVTKTIETYEEA